MIETAIAYAKLNISLDIVSKAADGYHNIETVMQSISLGDEVSVECLPGSGVSVDSKLPYLPTDERNIAAKAAMAFFGYTGIEGYKVHMQLRKKIPVCAGLGGGSSDGACVIRILNRMFDTNLGSNSLEEIGGRVGTDVPFCITGGTKLGIGRGDVLADLPSMPRCCIVICKPPFSCSTPELFRRIKCEKIHARPDTNGIVAALEKGDLRGIALRMYNVFEDVLPRGKSDIADIKYTMHDYGALGAVMTGSGPTVFGLFDDEGCARNVCKYLKSSYSDCFMVETADRISIPE